MRLKQFLRKDIALPQIPAEIILIAIIVFILIVVGISAYLADDPNWARWHASYLGEGVKFSAHFFNYSMWLISLMLFGFSLQFTNRLYWLKENTDKFAEIKPIFIQIGLTVIAICVYLVGLFPRSYGIFPHDIFGHTIYFTFLLMCLASPWILPGFSLRFYEVSYLLHVIILCVFIAYWTGVSQSVFLGEIAVFILLVAWLWFILNQTKLTDRAICR